MPRKSRWSEDFLERGNKSQAGDIVR